MPLAVYPAHLLGHLKQVDDLHGCHEENNIHNAVQHTQHALPERLQILG
jgi:hypothetical protein